MSTETASPGPTCVEDLGRFAVRWEALRSADPELSVVTLGDAGYPANLGSVEGAPPSLFVRGTLLAGDARAVSVVGTRHASVAGLRLGQKMSSDLAEAGVTVVSGLARGIDAAAHRGALQAGGRTIAVLGSGLCCVYPPEHSELASEVAASGAVVSQWWPWSPASPEQFRRRNAVSSGLALATVVVEASARSGARLQGRLARSQGRLLLLAQPLVASETWAQALVESGAAQLVRATDDVLESLADRTLTDSQPSGSVLHQNSGSGPARPLQPGQSRQLSLDIG